MSRYNFKCSYCRDMGREGGCERCGLETQISKTVKTKEITLAGVNRMHIPAHYIKNEWDSLILKNDRSEYIDDIDFTNYTNQLDRVYEHLTKGGDIPNSAIITAPIGYGKTTWVYSCMLELMKNNKTVPPLISTSQLKSMQTKEYERPTWSNKWNGFSYNEFIESDVLFLTVTKGPEYVYATRLIIDVVDTRARLSKPTVIISDWPVGGLISSDRSGMLLAMLGGGTNVDPYKYLTNIKFNESRGE